jgi:hypothetical protein
MPTLDELNRLAISSLAAGPHPGEVQRAHQPARPPGTGGGPCRDGRAGAGQESTSRSGNWLREAAQAVMSVGAECVAGRLLPGCNEMPFTRHALENVKSPVSESNPGPYN